MVRKVWTAIDRCVVQNQIVLNTYDVVDKESDIF